MDFGSFSLRLPLFHSFALLFSLAGPISHLFYQAINKPFFGKQHTNIAIHNLLLLLFRLLLRWLIKSP